MDDCSSGANLGANEPHSPAVKRKCIVLTLKEKLEIIGMLDTASLSVIAEKYGVGKSTISDIKKNRLKILAFKKEMVDIGLKLKDTKVTKCGNKEKLDKAVYLWFKQKRMEGVPVSGPLLCEKAVQLSKLMFGDAAQFMASDGWKWRFCKRYGIKNLAVHGEKLSGDKVAAKAFVHHFLDVVKNEKLSVHQILTVMKRVYISISYPNRHLQ